MQLQELSMIVIQTEATPTILMKEEPALKDSANLVKACTSAKMLLLKTFVLEKTIQWITLTFLT